MPRVSNRTKSSRNASSIEILPLLREFVDNCVPAFENLPAEWKEIDIRSFSNEKSLWEFQVEAIKYAIRALYYYYGIKKGDKYAFWEELRNFALQDFNMDLENALKISPSDGDIFSILSKFFYSYDEGISFGNFSNRMSFWMATGSGKTLLIVKLIDILAIYMERGLIPKKDILFLSYRDDLIEQFQRHFEEYRFNTSKKPYLFELKRFGDVKEKGDFLLLPVFYYRSNNIKDKQGDKTIDFKDYDNNGNWYIILDEAHKGDKESSKSQQYFSILSRNGFLFNFSATFTDIRDILTTVYEFNLRSYIREGYGKVLRIFQENLNIGAKVKKSEDFTSEEKELIILKMLLLLGYLKKKAKKIRENTELNVEYHSPLAVFLGNSVNVEDSDVKLIFEKLKQISSIEGFEEYFDNKEIFDKLKQELLNSPASCPFEDDEEDDLRVSKEDFLSMTPNDVLTEVFNAETPGDIEIVTSNSDKEFALKLMTSDKPFALIKVGDAKKLADMLIKELNLKVQERFEKVDYFSNLDEYEHINILIGSRAFYEGWDSNRPNIIAFVNIGTGDEAKKFVLQSIGRGLRIQPTKNGDRKRLETDKRFRRYWNLIKPLETLYVWGTKKEIISKILEGVKTVSDFSGEEIRLYKNEKRIGNNDLLIPVARKVEIEFDKHFLERFNPLSVHERDYLDAKSVVENTSDEMLYFMFFYKSKYARIKIQLLREIFNENNKNKFFVIDHSRKTAIGWYYTIQRVVKAIENNYGYKYTTLFSVEDEEHINHYKRILIRLPENKAQYVKEAVNEVYGGRKGREFLAVSESSGIDLLIEFFEEHYYIPVLEALNREVVGTKIADLIKERSEIDFLNELRSASNKFEVDWWLFSKLVERKDNIYIPYLDKDDQEARFYPDFIFWFKKGNRYLVVFVDPKGTEHVDAERKIDGFEELFTDNGVPKKFYVEDYEVKVRLFFYNKEGESSRKYTHYWIRSIDSLVEQVNGEFMNEW